MYLTTGIKIDFYQKPIIGETLNIVYIQFVPKGNSHYNDSTDIVTIQSLHSHQSNTIHIINEIKSEWISVTEKNNQTAIRLKWCTYEYSNVVFVSFCTGQRVRSLNSIYRGQGRKVHCNVNKAKILLNTFYRTVIYQYDRHASKILVTVGE